MASKVTIRKNGLRQMAYYVTLSDGGRKRQLVYGRTNEEVRAKYSKEMADAVNGLPVMKNKITVEQFLNEWIGKARKIRESTKLGYQGEIRKHIIPKIGNIRLSSLSVITIQQMMDRLIKEGVSPRTTRILKTYYQRHLEKQKFKTLLSQT